MYVYMICRVIVNPYPNPYLNPYPNPHLNPYPNPYLNPYPNPSQYSNPYLNPYPNPNKYLNTNLYTLIKFCRNIVLSQYRSFTTVNT